MLCWLSVLLLDGTVGGANALASTAVPRVRIVRAAFELLELWCVGS